MERLLKGADNRFINKAREFIRENVAGSQVLLERLGLQLKVVRQSGEELDGADIGALLGDLIAANFESHFVVNITQEFERKFKDTIALMPKQDLIELAEALVSITAIERKASDDAGTVGGPIDVAPDHPSGGLRVDQTQAFLRPRLEPQVPLAAISVNQSQRRQPMARRQSSAYLRPLTRAYPAGSRFERSIDALTQKDSISRILGTDPKSAPRDRYSTNPTTSPAPKKSRTKPTKT